MDTNTVIVIVFAALALVAVVVLLLMKSRQTSKLRNRFGPEYERAVDESGDKRIAEAALHDREKRVKSFAIQPLRTGERERYVAAWRRVQGEFVDNPKFAVTHADELLAEVMAARGYPVGDFDQRSADLSVEHPVFVQNYRAAHDIAIRHARGEAGTEDLRQAMIHYRALFDDLVSEPAGAISAKAS